MSENVILLIFSCRHLFFANIYLQKYNFAFDSILDSLSGFSFDIVYWMTNDILITTFNKVF